MAERAPLTCGLLPRSVPPTRAAIAEGRISSSLCWNPSVSAHFWWDGLWLTKPGSRSSIPLKARIERGRAEGAAMNDAILQEISDFCRQVGLAESTFGRRAVNDGKLASRLRHAGRATPHNRGAPPAGNFGPPPPAAVSRPPLGPGA